MKPIAVEVLTITEVEPSSYTLVVNNEFFEKNEIKNLNEFLVPMIVIAQQKIVKQILKADMDATIQDANRTTLKDNGVKISLLLDEHSELIHLIAFGKKIPATTNYIEALNAAHQVLTSLKYNLQSEAVKP